MLVEKSAEPLVDRHFHGGLDFGVAKLRLGLAFELRLADLHVQHRSQPFAHIFAGEREVGFLQRISLGRVRVDRARQRRLEAGEVRAALMRIDVVDE